MLHSQPAPWCICHWGSFWSIWACCLLCQHLLLSELVPPTIPCRMLLRGPRIRWLCTWSDVDSRDTLLWVVVKHLWFLSSVWSHIVYGGICCFCAASMIVVHSPFFPSVCLGKMWVQQGDRIWFGICPCLVSAVEWFCLFSRPRDRALLSKCCWTDLGAGVYWSMADLGASGCGCRPLLPLCLSGPALPCSVLPRKKMHCICRPVSPGCLDVCGWRFLVYWNLVSWAGCHPLCIFWRSVDRRLLLVDNNLIVLFQHNIFWFCPSIYCFFCSKWP